MRAQGVAFSVMGLFSGTLIYTGSASDAFDRIGWKYYLGKGTRKTLLETYGTDCHL